MVKFQFEILKVLVIQLPLFLQDTNSHIETFIFIVHLLKKLQVLHPISR